MTRTDAIVFLQSHAEGRLCARIYRRSDGTVLTSDCPVGVAAIRARAVQAAGRAAAALVLLIGGGVLADQASRTPFGRMRLRAVQPIRLLAEQLFPAAPNLGRIPIGARCTGGIVAPFPPPTVPLPPPLPPTPNATDRPTTNGNVHPE
jgi:hypothetical protein